MEWTWLWSQFTHLKLSLIYARILFGCFVLCCIRCIRYFIDFRFTLGFLSHGCLKLEANLKKWFLDSPLP